MTNEYTAGLLDGEGCIQITNNESGRKKNPRLRLSVSITSTHPGVIQQLKDLFGGSVVPTKAKGKRAASWSWSITSRGAKEFLLKVSPHLIIKAPEAKIALAFQASMIKQGGHIQMLTEPELLFRTQCAAQLKALKRSYRKYATS